MRPLFSLKMEVEETYEIEYERETCHHGRTLPREMGRK